MSKKLGIDLGSASLGWFIREDDQIINNGVVTFSTGMTMGKGGYSSPTKDRREARSKRRLIQARKYRKIELLKVLIEYGFVPLSEDELNEWSKYKKGQQRKFPETKKFTKWIACDFSYLENGIKYKNPYELRVKAIDNKLSKHEFGRALYHLVQRRGYKDIGEKDNETETQIERRGESGFQTAMENNRTVAEALTNNFLKGKVKFIFKKYETGNNKKCKLPDKRARNEYPYRAEYEEEFKTICKGQGFDISQNDKNEYNDEFLKKLRKAIIWQRPLRGQKGNIGKCTLEPTKQRCPASHPIFEIFRTWSYINTIKTVIQIDEKHTKTEEIPIEYRKKLFNEVFLKKEKNFKFEIIQKFLDKLFKEKKTYNYLNKSTEKYDSTVSGMPVCKGLIKLFGENVKTEINRLHTYNIGTKEYNVYNNYSVYDLWHLIFNTDDDHLEEFAQKKLGKKSISKTDKDGRTYTENEIVNFKKSSFSTSYSDLSLKAMCKIIPFLQEGFLYNEAVLLAKIPDEYKDWKENKKLIYQLIENANVKYSYNKIIVGIANNLINKYKALTDNDRFAHKDYSYKLDKSDFKEVEKTCISTYGQKSWNELENQKNIIDEVSNFYQSFFNDEKRRYIKLPTLTDLIEKEFENNNIEIDGEKLYHHSDRQNLYLKKLPIDKNTNKHILPVDKKTQKTILPVPLIDSIKNPMFNKSMSVLRKLINELIVQEYVDSDGVIQSYIDEDTEIIVEVARELNDNNKRIAIERYQKEREANRAKYREFIREFKEQNNKTNFNVEDNIPLFEMWTEQTFEETFDENGNSITNKNPNAIRKENDAIKRYELWSEQKGQCMYTGKMIGISQLFSNSIEIEHTIPRSLLPDNTMANLTVCYSKYNSDIKNNRIPTECPNFKENTEEGTAIEPKLEKWKKIRDNYKKQYKDRTKPFGNEDESKKNKRIQEKHYFKMHFDYWNDKINRFTTEEIKDSWVRRQLTDTQMVSKYALEFLKTYFKKVVVQKGSTTADFRKIFGFQGDDKKDRSKHTHHSIDAAVLTLIPINSSKRVDMLNRMYKLDETESKQFRAKPDGFSEFNAQELINYINDNTLIVNYQKDKITEQTYRNVRKRGKLQYLESANIEYIEDNGQLVPEKGQKQSIEDIKILEDTCYFYDNEKQQYYKFVKTKKGEIVYKQTPKTLIKQNGTTIRGKLFQETFIGKIKDVERDKNNNKPLRNDDKSWQYKEGKDEFVNVVRKPISEAKIEDIVDPDIKRIIQEQKSRGVNIRKIKDHQGNIIRHVRVKTRAGKVVKERLNYKSKHDYKNKYYSAAGEIPYAIFITIKIKGKEERKMIPVPIHEIAQTFKDIHKFDTECYLNKFHPDIKDYQDIKLLKVGQKVFVLKNDNEFEKRFDIEFQMNRMYKIVKFFDDGEGGIYLKYHLEATEDNKIDQNVKELKHLYLKKYDDKFDLPEIIKDDSIKDISERNRVYEDKKYRFVSLENERFKRLIPYLGEDEVKRIKNEISKYKKQSSIIEKEGQPLLKISSKKCNFLFENYDFEVDITGKLTWLDEDNKD